MKVIEVEQLSKKYLMGSESQNPYASLKELISDGVKSTARRLMGHAKPISKKKDQEFFAVNDVSFSLEAGDRLAILGRNGAGKSTLLKLLTRITEPTSGRIKIRGRIASLLEVGTGFHPDLSGRENIFLNGAIMGMSYQEMKLKFDEIVAFADIEKFLDTPIKRYSSGMYMRLGFAVAAHLDSDLLILDEVLAVGDAQFQEKCLNKVNEMGTRGQTVIFVSHSIQAVMALCNKGILLEQGQMKCFEPIDRCVNQYIRACPTAGLQWTGDVGDEHLRVRQASLKAPVVHPSFFTQSEKTTFQVDVEVLKPRSDLMIGFSVLNSCHQLIARSRLCDHGQYAQLTSKPGFHQLAFDLDLNLFHPGEYQIKLESSLFNTKKILNDEVLLKFAIFSHEEKKTFERGSEKEGISLGNRWSLLQNS